jgi:hypothetical protein
MDTIIYLITFRYVWTRPDLAGPSFTPPKAGTVVLSTESSTSYRGAMGIARSIMDGDYDDSCGFVTTVRVERKGPEVKNPVAMARRDRVVGCACGEHQVHSRIGRWTKDAHSAFSSDICATMMRKAA